ncbi:MAG: hypothetical protein ACOY3Y_12030 [Acidobacteriota bacterium]
MLPLIINLLVAVALLAILLAFGRRVLHVSRIPIPLGVRLPADLLIGAATLGLAVTTLALTGALSRWSLVATLGVAAAIGRWRRPRGWRWLVAPGSAALVVLPLALAPPVFYDALVYHLGLPWQALLEGGFRPHAETVFSAFPPLAQLLALPPLAFDLDRVPALLHLVAFVLAGAGTSALATQLGAPRPHAALAGACVPLLPSHVLLAAVPGADGWMLAPLAAGYALALSKRPHPSWAPLVGALVGAAMAARLQAIPWALGAAVLIAIRFPRRIRSVALYGFGALAASAPWWLKNLILLGQPVAPLGFRREGIETLWRDAGTIVFSSPAPLHVVARLCDQVTPLLSFAAPLALAAVLAVVQRRESRHAWAMAAALAGGLAWAATGSLPRFFAMTAVFLLALAASPRSGPGRWAATAVLVVLALTGIARNVGETASKGGAGIVLEPEAGYTQRMLANDPMPAFAAARRLPGDARVLFVGEPRGFPFPRRFDAPSQHDVSPLRAHLEGGEVGDARRWLNQSGFTHLLVNHGELARLAPGYPVAPYRTPAGARRWAELLGGLGPPTIDARGVVIYPLSPRN